MESTVSQSHPSRGASVHGLDSAAVAPAQGQAVPGSLDRGRSFLAGIQAFRIRGLVVLLWVGVFLLLLYPLYQYSMNLAATRIYQVDECQNVYVARILATDKAGEAYSTLSLYQWPLMWLARHATHSVELFASARLLSLLIFWLNIALITVATGAPLLSRKGLIALLGGATLAPLWDYGFEIRHDNLLLTGLLVMWCAVRAQPVGRLSYFIVGALAVIMQFTAFKAFVYTLPLTLGLLAFPPSGSTLSRRTIAIFLAVGALFMFALFRVGYGVAGLWDLYVANFDRVMGDATGAVRFAPWITLSRLLTQTPLLLALVPAGLVALGVSWFREGRAALTWDGPLPEGAFFLVTLAALFVNPTPYPYNLVNLVPFAYLLAFRYGTTVVKRTWSDWSLRPMLVTILLFAHLVPFLSATGRHFDRPNYRQQRLMQLAETLTDPSRDAVYDGIGMVPTRGSIGYHWFLHSFNIQSFKTGPGPRVRELLAAQPPAVIIPSYRTDWLPEEDHEFIRERYVALGDDFWVLGKVLPSGGGAFNIIHPGRYRISHLQGSGILGTYPETLGEMMAAEKSPPSEPRLVGTLDGASLTGQPLELTAGSHQVKAVSEGEVAVVWVGPQLDRLPDLGRGDHTRLFVNWY